MSEQSRQDQPEPIRRAVMEFERPLLGYAARLTGNVEAARDVVQEVFLRMVRETGELNGRMPQWLFAVCRNLAIDAKRKGGRVTMMTTLSPAMEATLASANQGFAAEGLPVAEGSAAITNNLLALLTTLPEAQEEVIRLRMGAGLSYKQIAEVTGHSVSNVGFLMHVALKTLREKLKTEPRL